MQYTYTEESVLCECGNTINGSGFDTCLPDGTLVEPTLDSKWDCDYLCNDCGLVHNII